MSSRLGDGLWSTKFILPEHGEAMERQQLEEGRQQRPTLDTQELELIERALAESYRDHCRIRLRLFDEYEDIELAGIVTAVHTYRREVKLATGPGDWQWVRISDIISVV
ncbi:hypothetical protein J25TS5_14390 [Paenibacillus faecis]|uniref:YolD-like family protein n=1 Tax=Paenibacillus faecis TaxID=862114 RepID=UPI001B03DBC3|nr:YolD-like family protein [Paenibacillus faecis]GIO84507.1 hypothetical protein J25TS5_14390 [Paenibacillus faecis]